MPGQFFITLPVADVARSAAFYRAIGFAPNEAMSGEHAASVRWGDGVTIMLGARDFYATLTPKRIVDARAETQALFALAMESRDAVDQIAAAAVAAGGREAHGAEDEGFMYSRGFEDLDGHGWGPMWMDPDFSPGQEQAQGQTA